MHGIGKSDTTIAPKQLELRLTQVRPTKNMVIYTAPDGKETIIPPYLSQEVLLKTFGKIPSVIKITVEDAS